MCYYLQISIKWNNLLLWGYYNCQWTRETYIRAYCVLYNAFDRVEYGEYGSQFSVFVYFFAVYPSKRVLMRSLALDFDELPDINL